MNPPETLQDQIPPALAERKFFDQTSLAIIGGFALAALLVISWMYPNGYRPARNTAIADRYLAGQQYEKAIPYLQAIIKQYPGAWMRVKLLGDCYLLQAKPDVPQALRQYEAAQRDTGYQAWINAPTTTPNEKLDWSLNEEFGICYAKLDQWDKAQQYFQQVLAQTPDNPAVNFYLGVKFYKAGDFGHAAECFQNAATGDKAVQAEVNDTEAPRAASKWGDLWDKMAEPYRRDIAKKFQGASANP